jgi:hypothetical protein
MLLLFVHASKVAPAAASILMTAAQLVICMLLAGNAAS